MRKCVGQSTVQIVVPCTMALSNVNYHVAIFLTVLFGFAITRLNCQMTPVPCLSSNDCGQHFVCNNGSCTCSVGFVAYDGARCKNESCQDPECLQCDTSTASCTKCASFLSSQSHLCLKKCDGTSEQKGENYICNESCQDPECLQCDTSTASCTKCASFLSSQSHLCLKKCDGTSEQKGENYICNESSSDDNDVDIVVAVVAGVGAGLVLCILVIVGVCIYIRKTRKKIDLQNQSYRAHQMEVGHVKQFPMYDNSGFETDDEVDYKPGKIDPLHYVSELDKLRPHVDSLMALLSQVKAKTRGMNSSDPRVPTYKGVIHQLCRVLVLIHKKDPVVSIPSDALSIIQWAHQMLDDHREQQSSSGSTGIQPIAQISSVDFDPGMPTSPVYATPEDSISPFGIPISHGLANPYSSVPVPVTSAGEYSSSNQRRSGRQSGFATISRTPSVPNGDVLKNMEEEEIRSAPLHRNVVSTFTSPQPVGFRKEDFLIDKSTHSLEGDNSIGGGKYRKELGERRLSKTKPPPEIFNTSSESYGDIDFTGPNVRQQKSSKFQHSGAAAKSGEAGNYPSIKKNIITNPNAKKSSNGINGHSSKMPMAPPNIGYFANGHYYDPNPIREPETDVYAPGSSYSNGSNVMSTFLGEGPLSRTPSSTDPSDDENCDSDNSGGDLDVFPFDPKEATNPVEV